MGNIEAWRLATTEIPNIPLHDGEQIPQLGFGVSRIPLQQTAEAVANALQTGFRHIDTAPAYGNEAEVLDGVREAGLEREQVFITTKCFNDRHGYDEAKRACHESLNKLGGQHIDLYLIHWPVPSQDLYVETWKAFIDLRNEGVVRSIGVSNFQPEHLQRLIDETGETPAVNQVELHPHFAQVGVRATNADLGIVTEAWSPLGVGRALRDETIVQIAAEQGRSPAQVVIRWHLQLGNVLFPKSVTPKRMAENIDVFDFELTDEQMLRIHELDRGERNGPDPDTFVRS